QFLVVERNRPYLDAPTKPDTGQGEGEDTKSG
ncbi:MAG: hypothetical protein QOH93_41, partial [Chloroflexia bacterium]|nr:hypothetical protein [Chloroflexia bacterium]